ncbi:hypothetical protein MIR68_008498 [Amoeboaphelidium protococcarum]|nr:hypothetical protein MIR68_008498 [Amoeboaphelidium protococcarum]
MSQLVSLLDLPHSLLYQYLRPVDFLQLSKCNKECQGAIVNQKFKVRDAYFRYYGPLLTAYRIKFHKYLQLQSEEDYIFFFHGQIKKYNTLLSVISQDYAFRDGVYNITWNNAVNQFYSANVTYYQCPKYYNSWSEVYALNKEKEEVKLNSGEILASSQYDLLVILYRAFVKRNYQLSDPRRKPLFLSQFGYYQDAVKNFQLDALVRTINSEFDVLIEEMSIVNHVGSRHGLSERSRGYLNSLSLLCQYFQIGSFDDIREKLAKSIESSPDFQTLYAYFNVIALQQQYNHQTAQQQLFKYVVRILNYSQDSVLKLQSVGFVKHTRDKMLISAQMYSLLKAHLTHEWVKQKINDVKAIKSVETGWAILSLLQVYDPTQCQSVFQKFLYRRLCRCRNDDAMYMVIAAHCYDLENFFQWMEQEMSHIAIKTLVKVLEQLLNIEFVVTESKFFQLGRIFKQFEKSLVDHQQHLVRVSLLKFSQVGHVDIDSCYYYHDELTWIIGSLGGQNEWARVVLNSDADFIAQLKGCIIVIGLSPDLDLMSQQMLDQVSVHLVNLFCGNEKLDFNILAYYFRHLLETSLYSEEAVLKLKDIASEQQLYTICNMLAEDEDVAILNFGSQFLPGWLNECQRICNEVDFPYNVIEAMHLVNVNVGNLSSAPSHVQRTIASAIVKVVLKQPVVDTSRFWFFDGLPVSVLEDRAILSIYIHIWPTALLASESLKVYGYSELALGFFQRVKCDDILPEKQVSLIQMFYTEAKNARVDQLVCQIDRLIKQFYGCKMEALLGAL